MDNVSLSDTEQIRLAKAVERFKENRDRFNIVANNLVECFSKDPALAQWIHFIKYRVKDTQSLTDKLTRLACSDPPVPIDEDNIFDKIHDLAGVRIIHLHADQLAQLHPRILKILDKNQYSVVDAPVAYCWDIEYKQLFNDIGLSTETQSSMYTTVHYDIRASKKPPIICELQVRSLMDEVWGEVSHRVNYPVESSNTACQDQLKVLARLASGCGRLVDSIFKTHAAADSEASELA